MVDQLSFASLDFAAKKKRTKRDLFLGEMSAVVPWGMLEALIEPYYPKMGPQGGRRPFPLGTMLRIYCLQQWYNLSDPGAEEALYDIQSMRAFARLELGRDAIPDETTILNFRHLLERYELTKAIFQGVAKHLAANGELLRGGTIVDATLIAASPSTKNKEQKRDPEMTSSKKGNQWYFGMKAHIGVDVKSGLVHTAGVTTGKVHDAKVMDNLIPRGRHGGLWRQGLRQRCEEGCCGRSWRDVGGEGEGQARPRPHETAARTQPPLRQGTRQDRTRVPRAEMPVRLSPRALSRHRQERRAGVRTARARQLVSRARPTCVRLRENAGRAEPYRAWQTQKPAENRGPRPTVERSWLTRQGDARTRGHPSRRPHHRHQRLHAHDVHHARQIVGEHRERHLGRYLG
jgi:transposase, IS5 family